ncbi:MAG: cysteine protease StiP family protein [Desulfuromonadales bacterium]
MNYIASGSYPADDVQFLLKEIRMPMLEIREKERLIQSGKRHYSEMISPESPPSPAYLRLFHEACRRNNPRFCADLIRLARHLAASVSAELTLVSLARAGTPVGVLLKRILETYCRRNIRHYSISIIRDRGIDGNALRYILSHEQRDPAGIVFIDGWTGKGVIAAELACRVAAFNEQEGCALSTALHVVADISGTAAVAATCEDYLIPSAIMNSIVSGLVSRSILNSEYIGQNDFHGCIYYREFEAIDLSRSFVDAVMRFAAGLWEQLESEPPILSKGGERERLRRESREFLAGIGERYGVRDCNHIKPGIGEATRVLLRRVPHLILLQDETLPEVAHLQLLAAEKKVPVKYVPNLPYKAAAIIAALGESE